MERERHEQIARTWFTALGSGDVETMAGISTDDMSWWVAPGTRLSGTHPKAQFLGGLPRFFDDAAGDLTFEYDEIAGEGDLLAIVARSAMPMKDGRHYRSNHSFLLRFRDGKIAGGKEFFDAVQVNEIFGAPDENESNVEILKRYFAALERGDVSTVTAMFADDATYWILPGTAVSGTHDKASYLQMVDTLIEVQSGPLKFEYDEITAQGDRVAIAVRGHMPLKAGGSYDNVYHWLFTFRDGKIVAVKEFCDAAAVGAAFGIPKQRKAS